MMGYMIKDGMLVSHAQVRRYVASAALVYFVLCFALLFVTWHLVEAQHQIAIWQQAYCEQYAYLWAAEHGDSYLQSDLAGCR